MTANEKKILEYLEKELEDAKDDAIKSTSTKIDYFKGFSKGYSYGYMDAISETKDKVKEIIGR